LTALASLYLADRALVPLRLAFGRQRQFAAAASHELRTPLAILRSQAELVERYLRRAAARDVEGADRACADVQEILAEVDYMSRLVRDLLVLARDETDQRGLAWKTLDANALAKEATAKVRSQADLHSLALTLVTAADESPVWIRGDADRLRQLLLTLLENAIRYTDAGGAITVEVRALHERHLLVAHADVVQIVITDTGRGINPRDLERIFEPFYRAAHTYPTSASAQNTEQDTDGAGLGLSLAQWIATAHGGQITVRSHPGAGSSFTVSLRTAKGEYAV
jgi:signal transduction histidine kinase